MTRLAIVFAALLTFVTAAPAAADPGQPDLAVTVAFDRESYFAADDVTVTVAVINNGSAPARNVLVTSSGNSPFDADDWGVLSDVNGGTGTDIAPGERVEVSATHRPDTADALTLTVVANGAEQDAEPSDNTANATATISVRTTTLRGLLYWDLDGDEQYDQGEALSGVEVSSDGGQPNTTFETRTDAGGRFVVADLPEGYYALALRLPVGWQEDETKYVDLRVGGGEVLVRAVRDSSALRSSIAFDRTSYAVGDTVREKVTITNTGAHDLTGVTARCDEGAAPNTLSGLGWGDLVHDLASGVTVKAGETRTFEFTDVVPAAGRFYGYIKITCWFGTAFQYYDGEAAIATARVPGGTGTRGGYLFVDRDDNDFMGPGEGQPGVKLFLVEADGTVVARAVTDAAGHFWFRDVPANVYTLRLSGPWRPKHEKFREMNVYESEEDYFEYAIVPGPTQPDLDAPPPARNPPSVVDVLPAPTPQPRVTPRPANLADTGADVVEFAAFGAVLLCAGAALVLFFRRPREDR